MKVEMVQCDLCCELELADEAGNWTHTDEAEHLCPRCFFDERAVVAEHDLATSMHGGARRP